MPDGIKLTEEEQETYDSIQSPSVKKDFLETLEKWNKLVSKINELKQENKNLKEESNNLKFRLADEQDEINRINGEWRKDKKTLEKVKEAHENLIKDSNFNIKSELTKILRDEK